MSEQFLKIPFSFFRSPMIAQIGMSRIMVYLTLKSFIVRTSKVSFYKQRIQILNEAGYLVADVSQEKIAYYLGMKRQTVSKILKELVEKKWIQIEEDAARTYGANSYVLGVWKQDQEGNRTEHFYADFLIHQLSAEVTHEYKEIRQLHHLQQMPYSSVDDLEMQLEVLDRRLGEKSWQERFIDTGLPTFTAPKGFCPEDAFSAIKSLEHHGVSPRDTRPLSPGATYNIKPFLNKETIDKENTKTLELRSKSNEGSKSKDNLEELKLVEFGKIEEDPKKRNIPLKEKKKEEKEQYPLHTCAEIGVDCGTIEIPAVENSIAIDLGSKYSPLVETPLEGDILVEIEASEMARRKDQLTQELDLGGKALSKKEVKGNKYAPIHDSFFKALKGLAPTLTLPKWGPKEWGQIKIFSNKFNAEEAIPVVSQYFEYVVDNWSELKAKYKINSIVPTVGLLCSSYSEKLLPEAQMNKGKKPSKTKDPMTTGMTGIEAIDSWYTAEPVNDNAVREEDLW